MPSLVYDGDFTVAQATGQPIFSAPFLAFDSAQYLYRQKYWQLRENFSPLPSGTDGPFGGFHAGESSFNDEGGGIISFWREFALLPATHNENETFVYEYHLPFYNWGFADSCVQPVPIRVNSRIQSDYFQTNNPELDIALTRAPQILDTCIGRAFLGDYLTLINPETPSGTEILAEDATYKLWKANIYERRQRFIKWISVVDLILPP